VSTERPVEAHGLTKRYRHPLFPWRVRVEALRDYSFSIDRGEVFGLLGPNGSGKSTTIKILLGLNRATAGSVRLFGGSPDDLDVKRRIGYLPEESHLYRFLDAEETLDFYAKLFGLSRSERRRRVAGLLDLVGLTHERKRRVSEYSKGMQRRVAIAQSLINDPELVVLDEPTSGMDPLGTAEVKELILRLKEKRKTVLLSSHQLVDVEQVCDRVSILYGGREQLSGRVGELVGTPGGARDLEALFLETVDRARQQHAETSGSRSRRDVNLDFLAER